MPDRFDPSNLNDHQFAARQALQKLDQLAEAANQRLAEAQKLTAKLRVSRNERALRPAAGRKYIWTISHHGKEVYRLSYSVPAPLPVAPPPRIVELIFWLLLPRKHREAIMGDAAEAYAETVRRYGRGWATVDYCKEAVFMTLASVRMSIAEWIRLVFRRSS